MITAEHDGITLATTTGTEADTQMAVGLEAGPLAPAAPEALGSEPAPAPAESAPVPAGTPVEAGAPEAVPAAEDTPAPPPKDRSYQSRIDRLRWEAAQAQQIAVAAQDRIADLEARLAQTQAVAPPPTAQSVAEEPQLADFSDYEAWVKASIAYHANRIADDKVAALSRRVEAAEAERARVEALAMFHDRIAQARSELPDYDAYANRQDVQVSQPVADFIVHDAEGPRLAYALGKEPEVAEALSQIPPNQPLRLAVEIGRVLARHASVSSGPPVAAASRTSAPSPIKPVGAGAMAATVPLDQLDFREYKRIRDQQEQEWRRSRL